MEGEQNKEHREIELCLRDEQEGRIENKECSKQEGIALCKFKKRMGVVLGYE